MAKRVRVNKQDGGPAEMVKAAPASTSAAPKSKAATPPNAEGKHVMLPAFLSKTYEIFSMPEFSHVCGWNANGDTIIVSQLEAFVSMVLPRFFKHRNFPSFVRQLNLYGFHKTVLDSKRLEFQHPYFKRGRPDLLHHIKRKVSNSNHHNQQLVNSSIQNSRLDAHREISDTLLREMKELRQRSDAMEKRLRELEIDNAIVRSDNLKLWKHLETAKDKQLIMQEKMKKIMWILFQIYRGKQQNLPKLSSNDSSGAVVSEDMLGPKEFRDVLRFLAMDDPPLLPGSSSDSVPSAAQGSRKRKFVEVPSDVGEVFSAEGTPYKLDVEPSSVVEVPNSVEEPNPFAMTVPSSMLPVMHPDGGQNNVLSIFSPISAASNAEPSLAGFLTNGVQTTSSAPLSTASVPTSAPSVSAMSVSTPTATTSSVPTPIASTPAVSTPPVISAQAGTGSHTPSENTATSTGSTPDAAADTNNQLAFLDEELPLLPNSDHYNFTDGEQTVMKKLEDFESSLLDEYDVSCLDTLLQQLKNSNGDKSAEVSVTDPEEVVVGPSNGTPRSA